MRKEVEGGRGKKREEKKEGREGRACGADNFVRKPYNKGYLLSRIDQMLANCELLSRETMQTGLEIVPGGQRRFIKAERQQIRALLMGTSEDAVRPNDGSRARGPAHDPPPVAFPRLLEQHPVQAVGDLPGLFLSRHQEGLAEGQGRPSVIRQEPGHFLRLTVDHS